MSRRRAFATITALALVGIVGITLATLTAVFARDVKRSLRQHDDAQLRQLLIAGEIAARESLGREATGEITVALPDELQSADNSLAFQRLDGSQVDVVEMRITARDGGGRSMRQTLTYAKGGNGWQLQSATPD
jgi:hypothetical protein